MALFCEVPALHHSTRKKCMLDLPLAKHRLAREQCQSLDAGDLQGYSTRGGNSFFSWFPVEVKDTLDCLRVRLRSAVSALRCCLLSSSMGSTLPVVDPSVHGPRRSESADEVKKKSANKIPYILITAIETNKQNNSNNKNLDAYKLGQNRNKNKFLNWFLHLM